jgi:hypothetical protein
MAAAAGHPLGRLDPAPTVMGPAGEALQPVVAQVALVDLGHPETARLVQRPVGLAAALIEPDFLPGVAEMEQTARFASRTP